MQAICAALSTHCLVQDIETGSLASFGIYYTLVSSLLISMLLMCYKYYRMFSFLDILQVVFVTNVAQAVMLTPSA